MIKINGYKLYGVTKVVKKIKQNDFYSFEVVKIDKKDEFIFASFIPDFSIWPGELVIPPKFLKDPRNCKYYQDYIRTGRKEATYADTR